MRQGDLVEFFDLSSDNPLRNEINFLSIPIAANMTPVNHLIQYVMSSIPKLLTHNQRLLKSRLSLNKFALLQPAAESALSSLQLSWMIVSTPPSMSPCHYDAGHYNTFLHCVTGFKLIFLRDELGPPAPNRLTELVIEQCKWHAILLAPGHTL